MWPHYPLLSPPVHHPPAIVGQVPPERCLYDTSIYLMYVVLRNRFQLLLAVQELYSALSASTGSVIAARRAGM